MRPLALGGTDTGGNVQVLCRECHGLKSAMEFGGAAVLRCRVEIPPRPGLDQVRTGRKGCGAGVRAALVGVQWVGGRRVAVGLVRVRALVGEGAPTRWGLSYLRRSRPGW
ncbi:HNH endonuclease [Streptomyces luteoverticillatus]|uniref:HNH endonuclease n=1 Tax=Streptomyces luteoverticillatus TaxID=66425 RepID=UPI001F0B99B2|nr:HNH endonuclease signature motif containing protein [Streptomyces luteoverticillatus]